MRTNSSQIWLNSNHQDGKPTGVLGAADAVLNVGAPAVLKLQQSNVLLRLVGDEHYEPVVLQTRQRGLRPRVAVFAAAQGAGSGWPPGQVQACGHLAHTTVLILPALLGEGDGPVLLRHSSNGLAHRGFDDPPQREADSTLP